MRRISLALFPILLAFGAARAESLKDTTPSITVTGSAFEEVVPDKATIFLGVVSERPTAAEAAAENARAAQAVIDEIKAQGVAEKNIATLGATLAPYSSDEPDLRGKPGAKRLVQGFRARNDISVTVVGADKAGKLLGQLVDKGANRVHDVTFDISDAEARMDRLRQAAVKDAERRARAYVEALGLRVARVLEVRPEPDEQRLEPLLMNPRLARVAAAAPDSAPVPLQAGTKKLAARVSVTWALAR